MKTRKIEQKYLGEIKNVVRAKRETAEFVVFVCRMCVGG